MTPGGFWVCSVKRREKQRRFAAADRQKDRDRKREWGATRRHGITRLIRDWMYESQDGRCAGCGTPSPDSALDVDHDHACCLREFSCGACVRGLLCASCNARDVLSGVMATRFARGLVDPR